MRAFAFVILVFKIWSSQSAAGVSLKTLQLYAMVFFFRLVSILVYDGYLPFDRFVRNYTPVACDACVVFMFKTRG